MTRLHLYPNEPVSPSAQNLKAADLAPRIPPSLLLAALLLLAASCSRAPSEQENASAPCNLSAEAQIAWRATPEPDTLSAAAEGETCAAAHVTLALKAADGTTLWSDDGAFTQLAWGAPAASSPVTPEHVQSFLDAWVHAAAQSTDALPPWAPNAEAPAGEGPFTYASPLGRAAYEQRRASAAPMLCLAAGAETVRCLAADPNTGETADIVEYGA